MVIRASVSKGPHVSLLRTATQALLEVVLRIAGLWMGAACKRHRGEDRTQLHIPASYLGFRVSSVVCSVLATPGF